MILRNRILGLAAVLATLFLSLIGYTLVFFSQASTDLSRVVEKNLAVEKTVEGLNSTILRIRSDIWDTMVFDLAHRSAQVDQLDAQARGFYQGLRDLAALDAQFAPAAGDLRVLFQDYYQFGSTILELKSLNEFVGQGPLVRKFQQNQANLLARLSQTVATSKEAFFGTMEKLKAEFSSTSLTAFGLAIAVTLASLFIGVWLARRLARPLERLTETAKQVSGGDYSVRPEVTSSGEIRDLTETFVTMLEQIEAYSDRMEDLVRARTDALVRTNAVMVKELKLAQKIQDALIPRQFPAGLLSVAGVYLPMEDLGGDFYDVFEGAPGEWTLVMADVSGHGVPAALVTAMVKVSLGLHGPQTDQPGRALEEVNRELCAAIGDLRRYVTMILCHINLRTGTLAFCNAGHNELVVLRRAGAPELHGPNSGVVGLWADELFLTKTIPFGPGDSLVLFTDGLVEARGRGRAEFGVERLVQLIETEGRRGPQALVDRISSEVHTFSEGQPRQDDIAFLAVRWEEAASAHPAAANQGAAVSTAGDSATRAEELLRSHCFTELVVWADSRLAEGADQEEASRLHHWRALGLHYQGKHAEALQAWDRALAANPDNRRARRSRDFLARHLNEAAR